MKKLVAFTLAAGMVLTTLSGCAAKKTQGTSSGEATSIVESEAEEIADTEDKNGASSESQYDEPDNVVIEYDGSKLIDLPTESIKVTLRGKQILPGRDTAETLQESFESTFVDNSRFAINRARCQRCYPRFVHVQKDERPFTGRGHAIQFPQLDRRLIF